MPPFPSDIAARRRAFREMHESGCFAIPNPWDFCSARYLQRLGFKALAPKERWWFYAMTVATTGQTMQKSTGWRKALRAALADNLFVKAQGLPP